MTSRTYIYCRVSTHEQTTENQVIAIEKAGYNAPKQRIFADTCSGGKHTSERPEWQRLIDRVEEGDEIVVLKLDRLGRDAIDVQKTAEDLLGRGIKLVVLDLPVSDLSSAEGRMMLGMFAVFARFEKDRLVERTKEGLERAKKQGKTLGRPVATETTSKVQQCKQEGLNQVKTAERLGISLSTVKRHWKAEVVA